MSSSSNKIISITLNLNFNTNVLRQLLLCFANCNFDLRYQKAAEHISKLFKDRPSPPLETAIYWVEYVIRYNGAPHLRSAGADLPWYQYYLIDVFAVIIVVLGTVLYFVAYAAQLLRGRGGIRKEKMN